VHHVVNAVRRGEDHRVNRESRIEPCAVEHDRKPDAAFPELLEHADPGTSVITTPDVAQHKVVRAVTSNKQPERLVR